MENFSDGKSDGLAFVYVKNGVAYPVALDKTELSILDHMISAMLTKIYPMFKYPLGKIEDLMITKKE